MDVAKSVKKVKKAASNKKRKVTKLPEAETIEAVVSTISEDARESKSRDEDETTGMKNNMDVAKSVKKVKKAASNKKRKVTKLPEAETNEAVVSTISEEARESKSSDAKRDKKTSKSKKKKRDKESRKEDSACENVSHSDDADQKSGNLKSTSQIDNAATLFDDEDEVYEMSSGDEDETTGMKNNMDVAKSVKKVKKAASKKRKVTKLPEAETIEAVVSTVSEDARESKSSDAKRDKKTSKSKKKKRDKESRKKDSARENVSHSDDADQKSGNLKSTSQIHNAATLFDDEDEVYEMSSGDEDETTGMKRWITKYHRARPGAEVLMENINDFLVDYAAQKERGRKKTTEAESGTTVGSVAPAAVMDKLSKKKDKQVGLNFYRFQKREAQRNEIMMLQSKFEQDKKRIQELRAARKFRPY
nr:ribosomal RNA-processing protein 7 [Tanacetum cinerariifolium]